MNREESGKWAALLQAQADGKQLEYRLGTANAWSRASINSIWDMGSTDNWRIAPDLPPKPSQAWLDKHGVELTGECRVPMRGELWASEGGNLFAVSSYEGGSKPYQAKHDGVRWILRRRAPEVKPWTIDTVPMPLVVRNKQAGRIAVCVSADKDGVWLISNTMGGVIIVTYANLIIDFTQRDGSPCGEVVK